MQEKRDKQKLYTVTLEHELHHYRVFIEIEPGADIPPNLREILVNLLGEDERKLTGAEIQLIEEVFRDDITNLEEWKQVEIKKALINSHIGIKLKSGPQLTFNGLFQLPKEFIGFTGRREELKALDSHISKPKVITQKIAGTGGIGKTQLANYYARIKVVEGSYQWVIWLRGGNVEEENGFGSQFADLGSRLGINIKANTGERLIELVYQELLNRGKGIVIIDDVVDYTKIKKCLPQEYNIKNIPVLMTSRDTLNWGNEVEKLHLGIFEPEEALRYIKREIEVGKYVETEAKLLAETLGYFPLALTQALAYINNIPIMIKGYIEAFNAKKENQRKLLDYAPFKSDDHEATVYATVTLALKQIDDPRALKLLQICSYLASEVPIDVKLLEYWIEGDLELNEIIEKIKKYSLVRDSTLINYIEIHQIVQTVIVLDIEKSSGTSITIEIGKTLDKHIMSEKVKYVGGLEAICYLPHLQRLSKLLNQLLKENEVDSRKAIALVHYRIGEVYLNLGNYVAAKESLMLAWRRFCDFDHNSYLVALVELSLGHVMLEFNEYIKAQRYYDSAYGKFLLAEKNKEAILCRMYKALAIMSLGRFSEAKMCFVSILPELKKQHGDTNGYIVECEFNLGVVNCLLGDTKEAREYFKKQIEIYKDMYGTDHQIVGECHYCLGLISSDLELEEEAIFHMTQALIVFKKEYEIIHPKVVKCELYLAMLRIKLDDVDTLRTLEDALPKLKVAFGVSHISVAKCESHIGVVHLKQENFESADMYLKVALKKFESTNININNDINVAECTFNLGMANLKLDRIDDAKKYFDKCIKALGNRNFDRKAECEKYLGEICLKSNDYKEALTHCRLEYLYLVSYYGVQNFDVIKCQLKLGTHILQLGDYLDAKTQLSEVLIKLRNMQETYPESIALCEMNLGVAESKLNNNQVAKEHFIKALRFCQSNKVESSNRHAECELNLGVACLQLKQFEEAMGFVESALAKYLLKYGELNSKVAKCITNLGIISYRINRLLVAEKYFDRANKINKDLFGLDHIETAQNIFHFACLLRKQGKGTLALSEFKKIYPIYKDYFGEDHQCSISVEKMIFDLQNQLLNAQEILKKIPAFSPDQGLRRMVATGDSDILHQLLFIYADYINIPDDNVEKGYTPLHLAYFHQPQLLKILLIYGARYDIKDRNQKTVVDYAIEKKDLDFIIVLSEILIDQYSILRSDKMNDERVIYCCAEFNNTEALKLFLKLTNFDVNMPNPDTSLTALHYAVKNDHIECVKLLMLAGADPNIQDETGKTALQLAGDRNDLIILMTNENIEQNIVLN